MLQVQEYRSVPLRKVAISPTRRAALEIVLKQPSKGSTDSAQPAPASGGGETADAEHKPSNTSQSGTDGKQAARGRSRSPKRTENGGGRNPSAPSQGKVLSVSLTNIDTLGLKHPMNSPRSLNLCDEFGVHPDELVPRPQSHFKARGVPDAVAMMRFEHYETRRRQKLDALRQERLLRLNGQSAQHSTTAEPPAESPPATQQPLSLLPRYTQELIAKFTATKAPGKAASQRPLAQGRTNQQPQAQSQPQLLKLIPTRSSLQHESFRTDGSSNAGPSITPELREQRMRQLVEKDNRRRLVYERAQRAKEERQYESITKQVLSQQRADKQLNSARQMRLCGLEEQRLRREDTLTSIRMRRRQDEVQQTKVVQAAYRSRSMSAEPRDRFQVQLAKALYLTPRQRTERARSASATPLPTPRPTR